MNSKVILLLGLLAFSAFSAGVPDAATSAKLLALHNADRSEVGLSSLSWSSSLASSAQDWANNLAANGGLNCFLEAFPSCDDVTCLEDHQIQ